MGAGEKNQAYATRKRRKGKFGKFGSRKIKGTWLRFNAMSFKNMGTTKDLVLRSRRTVTKEEEKKSISSKKWRMLK